MIILDSGPSHAVDTHPALPLRVDSVHALVSAAGSRDPSAAAVVAPDGHLSYGDLELGSEKVAAVLRSLGIRREEPVALMMPSSAALVVGALGILKAGAAYVALDPASPMERLNYMLMDCGARVVLVADEMPSQQVLTAVTIAVSAEGPTHGSEGLALPTTPALPAGAGLAKGPLAYVIYTSGSTGAPKGVEVEQTALLNLVRWHQRAFAITPADRGTQLASPGFDAVVWEIWPYLTAGASVHIPPRGVRADPAGLRDWLVDRAITVSFVPTVIAEEMLTLPWPRSCALRYMLTGGDRLHRPPPPGLPFQLVNNYGVTEGAVVSTSGVVDPAGSADNHTPTIGAAIDGVELRVAATDLTAVPDGEVGELLIGGVSVARGYLGRPELTAERFVTPERLEDTDHRWYRTGDLVRRRADGQVEYLGRVDDQVQIRGFRIELGEVAVHLDRHQAIRASEVMAFGESAAERRLHAYVVPSDHSTPPSREELRDHLARTLPDYMIPTGFTWVDELPKTDNGKVDRNALPPPEAAERLGFMEAAGPHQAIEDEIASMVAGLLGLGQVGSGSNFFLLGGHSLLGAQLIAWMGDRFGVEIPLRTLFDNPTPAGLAAEVERLIIAETDALTDEQAAQMLTELSFPS